MLPLKVYIKNPRILLDSILRDYGGWIPDRPYLQMQYYLKMGKRLNLDNPQTFSEKIQWLKLYNRKPEYIKMVDKVAVKDYVASIIGEEYIIPTLGVWDKPEEIDFDSLPRQFVLKTTHGGGGRGVVICRDKEMFDRALAVKKLKSAMKQAIYRKLREWPYKNVKPRIIAEKYLEGCSGDLIDYKIHVFGGEPKIIQLDYNRFVHHQRMLFDMHWNKLNATIKYPADEHRAFLRPAQLEELLEIAGKLSQGIPYVRTDFYLVENKISFGELTFFHGSGYEIITPETFNRQMGLWIKLPRRAH